MTIKTHNAIKSARQHMHRAERQFALAQVKERKADVRRKIELGGLVIQSGLASESKAVILGALIDAAAQIEQDSSVRNLLQRKGETNFVCGS